MLRVHAVSWIRLNACHVAGLFLACGIVLANKAPRIDLMDEFQRLAEVTPAENSDQIKRFFGQATHAMSLYGRMVDAAGLPIVGAQVRGAVTRHRIDGNLTDPVMTQSLLQATTDAEGRFELFGVGSRIKVEEVAFADGAVMAPNPRSTVYQREHFGGLWGIQSIAVGGRKKLFVSTPDCPVVFVRLLDGEEPSVSATEGGVWWVRGEGRSPGEVLAFRPESQDQVETIARAEAAGPLNCSSGKCSCVVDAGFGGTRSGGGVLGAWGWGLVLQGVWVGDPVVPAKDLPE